MFQVLVEYLSLELQAGLLDATAFRRIHSLKTLRHAFEATST